jgi:hypothetical protein
MRLTRVLGSTGVVAVASILGLLAWPVAPEGRAALPPLPSLQAAAGEEGTGARVIPDAAPPAAVATTPRLPEAADQIVDYRIAVRLDAEKKQLAGQQRLTWRNPSQDAVSDLWFHLYLNAFKNTKSTFFRESGGQLRRDRMEGDGWGWIDVTSIAIAGGPDLKGASRFEAPDDGNADDQTVMKVTLPAPVGPGASITLDIGFAAQLPRVFARTGYHDDFFMVGQWFPKIGVYEPAGMRGRATGGWNCHQFHANSEFYADYGRYEVEMTLPRGFVLGATGERKARRENADGTVTYVHQQDNVHDFAWTASPHYVEQVETFSAERDVTREEYARVAALVDRSLDEVKLSDVQITLLLQPPHRPQAARYFESAKLAIKWFGLWYGRYPYRTLTVVDPAPGAGGAGGMEYPTLITGGTSFLLNRWPFNGIRAVEMVTVHEFGHNFWYGLVGNNEFEEAWLDEGVNSYSTAKVLDVGYGAHTSMIDVLGLRADSNDLSRYMYGPGQRYDRVRQPSWSYLPGAYSFHSYQKPELLLQTLENHLGAETMARVMRTYHERWRFGHPSSDDFYAVAREVSRQDLKWYFDQAVEGTAVLDYDVFRVTSARVRADAGHFDGPSGKTLVSRDEARKTDRDAADGAGDYESTVIVRRRGDFVFPVEVAFKFEGKPAEHVQWDGRETWKRYRFVRPEKLEWAEIDPDRKVLLEAQWLNNARRVEADSRAVWRASLNWLTLVQGAIAMAGW